MTRSQALFAAADDVIATQTSKLAIQNRFVSDMKLIWMLQLRFERRTGKNPYTLVAHPKYRAGYDFMLLRSLLGHVPESLVHWWEEFVEADPDKRAEMVEAAQIEARKTADVARAGRRQSEDERFTDAVTRYNPQPMRSRRRRPSAKKAGEGESEGLASVTEEVSLEAAAGTDEQPSEAPKPKRRRRRRPSQPKTDNSDAGSTPTGQA